MANACFHLEVKTNEVSFILFYKSKCLINLYESNQQKNPTKIAHVKLIWCIKKCARETHQNKSIRMNTHRSNEVVVQLIGG